MKTHALLSPSSADRWAVCPGSLWLEKDFPNTSSRAADEGSAAHELGELCLKTKTRPASHLGKVFPDFPRWPVTHEMAQHVDTYVDLVLSLGGTLYVEEKVSIEHITGEKGATGTSDAVVVLHDEIIIVDLKYGQGVKVDAENNRQMLIYGDAVREMFDGLAIEAKRVRMIVCQPRLNHVSEWCLTLPEMAQRVEHLTNDAKKALFWYNKPSAPPLTMLTPGDKQCRFCKAQAVCPALALQVIDAFETGTPNAETPAPVLAELMGKIDLIEPWCKAVRAEVERRLFAGDAVEGYKLVKGKKGNRQWVDESAAIAALKAQGLSDSDLFGRDLQSPAKIEKLIPLSGNLITQKEGKPSVARYDDKRSELNRNDFNLNDWD